MLLETPKDRDPIAADRQNLARLRRLLNGTGGRKSVRAVPIVTARPACADTSRLAALDRSVP
jgi:hypothetical protein